MFESWSDAESFMDDLDENFITEYWDGNYERRYDFETMKYYLDPWDYVNDERFASDWIDAEVDNNEIDDRFDGDHDKKYYLIPYLKRLDVTYKNSEKTKDDDIINAYFNQESLDEDNEDDEERIKEIREQTKEEGDADWILEELDCEHLRDLVREIGDECDLLRDYFENIYRNSSARDIIREFHSDSELDDVEGWWDKDYYNIMSYVDEREMAKDMPDPELEEMIREIDIKNNDDFQDLVFDNYPDKCVDMINFSLVNTKLASREEFQKAYFGKLLEDGLEDDEDFELSMDNVKEIINLGAEISDKIAEEFKIEHLVNADDMGLM